jgi:hypothetical protein
MGASRESIDSFLIVAPSFAENRGAVGSLFENKLAKNKTIYHLVTSVTWIHNYTSLALSLPVEGVPEQQNL